MCYLGFPVNDPAPPQRPTEAQAEAPKERPPAPFADEFFMYCFKVVECDNPQHSREDWDTCPFAHAGEVVTRRPPQTHLPKLCPKARRACRKGRACPYAHNVFEHWLHPSRFKTEICQHGAACMRPMCFFAHYAHEVRSPSPSADEVMAAAEAAGLLGPPHGAGCGAARCSGACYDGGVCGRAAPAPAAFGLGAAYQGAPVWGAPPPGLAAAPPARRQPQMPAAPAPLYSPFDAELAFATQCLRTQQEAAEQLQQAQAQAASAGWSGSDWSLLSSGGSSPKLLSMSGGSTPSAALMGAAAFGAAPPQLPRADVWSLQGAPQPCGLLQAGPGALQGLTDEEAFYLLAGLNAQMPGAASSLLCALQAGQANAPAAGFY